MTVITSELLVDAINQKIDREIAQLNQTMNSGSPSNEAVNANLQQLKDYLKNLHELAHPKAENPRVFVINSRRDVINKIVAMNLGDTFDKDSITKETVRNLQQAMAVIEQALKVVENEMKAGATKETTEIKLEGKVSEEENTHLVEGKARVAKLEKFIESIFPDELSQLVTIQSANKTELASLSEKINGALEESNLDVANLSGITIYHDEAPEAFLDEVQGVLEELNVIRDYLHTSLDKIQKAGVEVKSEVNPVSDSASIKESAPLSPSVQAKYSDEVNDARGLLIRASKAIKNIGDEHFEHWTKSEIEDLYKNNMSEKIKSLDIKVESAMKEIPTLRAKISYQILVQKEIPELKSLAEKIDSQLGKLSAARDHLYELLMTVKHEQKEKKVSVEKTSPSSSSVSMLQALGANKASVKASLGMPKQKQAGSQFAEIAKGSDAVGHSLESTSNLRQEPQQVNLENADRRPTIKVGGGK